MSMFRKKFPNTMQLEAKDCGPACLQMICKYYGNFYEMNYLSELCGVRREGISVFDFIKAAEKVGLKSLAFSVSYGKFRKEVPLPCVVHWKDNHFVVVYKITKKHIYVSDPQTGYEKYTYSEFAKGWLRQEVGPKSGKRGICIVCEPTETFQTQESIQRKPSIIGAFGFLWKYIKPYKKSVLQILAILLVLTLINALFPIITQSIIDVGIPAKDYGFIRVMLIASITLGISVAIAGWVKQLINMHFATRIKVSMLSDYLSHLFKLPLSFFENRLMGDLLQRSYDYDRLESMVMGAGFNAILGVLYLIVFGTILFIYNSTMFWVFLIASLLYVLWIQLFWTIRKKMDIRYFSHLAKNHSHWIELLTKIQDIKSYDYGQEKRWQWEKVQVNLYKTRVKLLHVDQVQTLGSNLLNSVKDALLIFIAANSVITGDMTLGMMIAVQYILGQLRSPMDNIVNFIVSAQMTYISYMRVSEINNQKTEDEGFTDNSAMADINQPLHLRNIYYKYSPNDEFVLKNINLTIPLGKTVALVGESGSGKSTLIKLLSRLYAPSGGTISLGAMNFSSISVDWWREHCGIITQESTLLKESVTNNIVFGRDFDKERVLEAVQSANIRSVVESMPKGYDTVLGENGRGVSEGQKQRILFARAIYNDPAFIFLDEMTSALDSGNEGNLIDTLKSQFKGKTIVIAAHRLSSVVDADIIAVLKNGVIVEIGTHSTLLAADKEYCRIFKNQINTLGI